MSAFAELPERQPRRGELTSALAPAARIMLHTMHDELREMERRADSFGDHYLAALIADAADEARDQLRDDLVLRQAASGAGQG
jgi:hypothetical protein